MEVCVGRAREIEVDDDVHRDDIDTTREEISTHEASGFSIAEIVVDSRKRKIVRWSVTKTYLFLSLCCIREWMKKHEYPSWEIFLANNSTRFALLQKIIACEMSSFEKSVFKQWSFSFSSR